MDEIRYREIAGGVWVPEDEARRIDAEVQRLEAEYSTMKSDMDSIKIQAAIAFGVPVLAVIAALIFAVR